jgi:hypothetical protein
LMPSSATFMFDMVMSAQHPCDTMPASLVCLPALCAEAQTLAFEVGAHCVCVVRDAASVVPLVVCRQAA